jgi:hypothetical protein
MGGPRIGRTARLGRTGPRVHRPATAVTPVVPTRFYLPSTNNTRPVSPAADASWEVATFGAAPLSLGGKLSLTKTNSNHAGPAVVKSNAANPCDVLNAQHVSDGLAAGAVAGTASIVLRCSESVNTSDSFLQLVIRLVSSAGTTVRGVLYAGQTATAPSATASDPNGEFATTSSTRLLTVTLTPVTAQSGDRLVVETGYRSCVTATGQTGFLRYGDLSATADHALGAGVTTDLVPWIEFSQTLTFA